MAARRTQPAGRRRWLFRGAAVLLGLSPLLIAELVFALLGWGEPDLQDDPFVGFRSVRPLFVKNEKTGRMEIPPARQNFFRPESFAANKPPGEFRVFCLGGSTVQGNPYAIETSFTTWLELDLQAADPGRRFEVVNCGGISYASYRLIPILAEVLNYEPDLIVVMTGQNEFLEDRTYGHLKQQPAPLVAVQSLAARSRTVGVLRGVFRRAGGNVARGESRETLPTEVDAELDYRGGLEFYHRDDTWRRQVIEHFDLNLRRMVQMVGQARVPLLLVNEATNLRDCPPFKSEHRAGLSERELVEWERLWDEARRHYPRDLRGAAERFERALAIDDQHAGLHYQLAQCLDNLRDVEDARRHYLLAKDLDICPLRMLEEMHERQFAIARQTATPLVDADQLLSARCRDGIADDSWLADHVHPSIQGHQLIADAILAEFSRQGRVTLRPGWESRRDAAWKKHLAALDEMYFQEGKRRLDGLQRWARGRATLDREKDSPRD